MSHQLEFDILHKYDSRASGIEVPVSLRLAGEPVDLTAKLDTGAPSCIFQREYGEQLGLTIESGQKQRFSTVSGGFWAYGHVVTLESFGFQVEAMVYFAEDGAYQRNVLGRSGWLNRVRIGIVDHDLRLYVSPHGA